MKLTALFFKTLLLTFLGGIISFGIPLFITKPLTPNELSIYIGWSLIFALMLSCFNSIFIIFIYLTTSRIQKKLSYKVYTLKYILVEIILLYILYYIPILLSLKRITDSWVQIFTPFMILYIVWIIIIIVYRKNVTSLDSKD